MTRRLVIAIDGPAASGKSSTAQWVASRLGIRHVDSGALYRAATAARIRDGGELDASRWSESDVLAAARRRVTLRPSERSFVPCLDGREADDVLRSADVTQRVSAVARMQAVRAWVNDLVRSTVSGHSVVADGRDIGTAVFPAADLKVFLVADARERARRRLVQRQNEAPTEQEIADEAARLVHRDAQDAQQSVPAPDAVVLDTTFLTQPEQVDRIVALVSAVTQRTDGTSAG